MPRCSLIRGCGVRIFHAGSALDTGLKKPPALSETICGTLFEYHDFLPRQLRHIAGKIKTTSAFCSGGGGGRGRGKASPGMASQVK